MGYRKRALDPMPYLLVLLDDKVYGYEGSGPWSVTTALILLPQ